MTIASRRKAALPLVGLAAAAMLGGCMGDPFRQPINTASPAAAEIKAISKENLPYPTWANFPATPKNVTTPAEVKSRTAELQGSQGDVIASAKSIDWTLSGTEEWANEARSQINPELSTPPPVNSQADTEAFVKAARERAAPPPPPK